MKCNIPDTEQRRVVIVGGGFAGLTVARTLAKNKAFQIVLFDKNNYHQFQPLFYQVAMAGLEPSSIVFPFRKVFQGQKNVFVRMARCGTIIWFWPWGQTPTGLGMNNCAHTPSP
jgi:NADH dehydrogenase